MVPPAKPKRNSGYIPSLDGWRAIAVLGVLFAHSQPFVILGFSLRTLQDFGGTGVDLFFAISGILITSRILEEERLTGRFDLKGFYIRRLFRIQPAAFVYLGVLAILMLTGIIPGKWSYWFAALLMFENFAYTGGPGIENWLFVGHFWSLAVEEHFYALLSTLLYFVKSHRLAILLGLYIFLTALHHHDNAYISSHGEVSRRTWWQLQFLIFPSAAAVALARPHIRAFATRWLRPAPVFVVWAVTVLGHAFLARFRYPDRHTATISLTASELNFLVEIFATLAIISTVLHPEGILCRLLESRPAKWVGRISYSLYLWHVLFIFRIVPSITVHSKLLYFLGGTPAKYVAAFACATASYYYIEKPLMRLGHKLAPPATPGRPELAGPSPQPAN